MLRKQRLYTMLFVLFGAATATACQEPFAPEVEPPPAPTPEPELRHDAQVILRRIDIEGGCDGRDVFKNPRKGHFAYRIRVGERRAYGNRIVYTMESRKYGDALGQVYLRGPGSSIDLGDRSVAVRGLAADETVTVTLYGIEWDVVVKDKDMNGKSATQTRRYTRDGLHYYELNLGSGDCKIELEYAIRWTTR